VTGVHLKNESQNPVGNQLFENCARVHRREQGWSSACGCESANIRMHGSGARRLDHSAMTALSGDWRFILKQERVNLAAVGAKKWSRAIWNSRRSMMALSVNGETYNVDVEDDTPFLWVLRDTIGLTGTKYGCGIAQCGACTVLIDGAPMRSCQVAIGTLGK